jgi:hypothetical protein
MYSNGMVCSCGAPSSPLKTGSWAFGNLMLDFFPSSAYLLCRVSGKMFDGTNESISMNAQEV